MAVFLFAFVKLPLLLALFSACAPWNPPFGQFIDDQLRHAREAKNGTKSGEYEITFSKPPETIQKGGTITVGVGSSKEADGAVYTLYLGTNPIYGYTGHLPDERPFSMPTSIEVGQYTFIITVEIDGSYYSGVFPLTITDPLPGAYTVTFNSNGGSAVSPMNVPYGAAITAPAVPARADYDFDGWFKEPACTTAWNFGIDTVTADITLYAKWRSPIYDLADFGVSAAIANTFIVYDQPTWKTAIDSINLNGAGNYVINLTGSFELPNENTVDNPRISSASTVSIRGNHTITLNANGNLLYIEGGKTVILRGPTLQGHNTNNASLVKVDGGTFFLHSGTITGNTANSDGGGVYVSGTGAFTMSGGTISGNTAGDNGGGINVSGGTFTMNGGTITNNTTTSDKGGGVRVVNTTGVTSTFTMTDGVIRNNTGGNGGGGVGLYGSGANIVNFTMSGGTISGNKASGNGGGGIHIDGDGVTFTMQQGAVIENNVTNASVDGAAVRFHAGTFAMEGGIIRGNTSISGTPGVWLPDNGRGSFTMSGGLITGNTGGAGDKQNAGVSVEGSSTFNMSGNACVDINNPVYLADDRMINIAAGTTLTPELNPLVSPASAFAARITVSNPSQYDAHQQVVTTTTPLANYAKFTVTPCNAGETWGIVADSGKAGKIYQVIASLTVSSAPVYYATLKGAIDESPYTGFSEATPDVITLLNNIATSEQFGGSATLSTTSTQHIKLVAKAGESYTIKRWSGFTASFFTVSINTSLELGGGASYGELTIDGGAVWMGGTGTPPSPALGATNTGSGALSAQAPLITVSGGILTLKDGAALQNNENTSANTGGAVSLNAGVFNMSGGVITKNRASRYAGGIQVSGGTVNMSGGDITSNYCNIVVATQGGGGGVRLENGSSTFAMTGGTISENATPRNGGGIYINGGGVNMSDGTISGNTADGINGDGGGGVYNKGDFTMSGGSIGGNSSIAGGGVYSGSGGTFTKSGGTIYGDTDTTHTTGSDENTATGGSGHAVYVSNGTKYRNTTAGPTDTVNTATDTDTQGNGFWVN